MFWNYVKLSFRKFSRQKFYSLLNIFGLAAGMATVILIMLYVLDEKGFDGFHQHRNALYRVTEHQQYPGQPVMPVAVTPGPLAESLKADFAEVARATRVHFGWNAFQYEDTYFDDQGIYVDPDFFNMFNFPLLHGEVSSALRDINSVVITEALAKRLFGDEGALGKMVTVNGKREVVVTGILKNIPENTHLRFSYVMPMSQRVEEIPSFKDQWGTNGLYTYVQLVPGASDEHFGDQIREYLKTKMERSVTDLVLQPLKDIHLDEVKYVADTGGKGNKQYVRIFSMVAVFILLIACINFMNLSTARAMKRAREVGLRKTIGAFRYQLILQFLGESILVALVSMAIALLMVDLLLSPFNTLTQKALTIDYTSFQPGGIIPVCLIATLVTGLLAGSYPAIFLSSFQPAHVLKGGTSGKASGGTLRKVLVVVQFGISIVMISGTLVISSQMSFIRNKNLGWERENMLMISNVQNYAALKNQLEGYTQVKAISATNQHPSYVMNSTSGINWKGKNEEDIVLFHIQGVDYGYVETMQMELLMGRSFSRASPGDTLSVLINEEAMALLEFKDPLNEYLRYGDEETFQIIGVVKNFHFRSVHEKIEPLILYIDRYELSNMLVRIDGSADAAVAVIEKEWKALNPGQLLNYKFMDAEFDNLYQSESRTGLIFRYFSTLAIIISCLGLFGLAAFTVEQKSKEYGIRKVFGASTGRLFYLASAEFLLLVVIAFVISVPLAWYWMSQWLSGFAYHVELSWMIFAVSGIASIIIALVTVSYQAGKVGWINPAKTLRMD